jgi:hypothetical protein
VSRYHRDKRRDVSLLPWSSQASLIPPNASGDFLDFNVRRYKVKNSKSGYQLLIKPGKQSAKKIRRLGLVGTVMSIDWT